MFIFVWICFDSVAYLFLKYYNCIWYGICFKYTMYNHFYIHFHTACISTLVPIYLGGRRGCDHRVVRYTHAIREVVNSNTRSWPGVLDTTLCDKVCQRLATVLWFSPSTPVSSTNKTSRHDINPPPPQYFSRILGM